VLLCRPVGLLLAAFDELEFAVAQTNRPRAKLPPGNESDEILGADPTLSNQV